MNGYQMNSDQLTEFYKTDFERGKNSAPTNDKIQNKKRLISFKDVFLFCKNKLTFVSAIALAVSAIVLLFAILNKDSSLVLMVLASLFLFGLIFVSECALLCYFKKLFFFNCTKSFGKTKVLRDGNEIAIDENELSIGDVIFLEKGAVLNCDARIVASENLFADEKVVFFKTIPSEKDFKPILEDNVLPEDQRNMLWKGSHITNGCGKAVVVALDEDCYIYKTGGRNEKGQHSFIYNRQNNIGKIFSALYCIVCFILSLLAAVITGNWFETGLVFSVLMLIMTLEPISAITEWNYFISAKKLYDKGALIRNIEAFDGMNKEREIYFDSSTLLEKSLEFDGILALEGDEKKVLSYLSLVDSANQKLAPVLKRYGLDLKTLQKDYPCYRNENDDYGNKLSALSDDGESIIVAAGYWKNMLHLVREPDEETLRVIDECELHGKAVWIIASYSSAFIPNNLSKDASLHQFKILALATFNVGINREIHQMILRLKRTSIRVHLINGLSEKLDRYIQVSYDIDDVMQKPDKKAMYSFPADGDAVAFEDDSEIKMKSAQVILKRFVSPQDIVYRAKCMFCGIRRSLNFMLGLAMVLVLGIFASMLYEVPANKIVFSILLLQPILMAVCHYLVASVRNCNQSKKSMIFGALFGMTYFIAVFVEAESAWLVLSLALILFMGLLRFRQLKRERWSLIDVLVFAVVLILALTPWLILGAEWGIALLLAVFPVLSVFLIDLIY